MPQPLLRTDRITLIPLADEHLEYEVELDSDPEVLRYLYGRARRRAEVEAAHRLRMAAADAAGLGFWSGFVDDEYVGWWLLRPPHGPDQPAEPGAAELGYRLLRQHWRRGYASEASRELIRHGFDDVGLVRIFAQTMAVNGGSRAVMTSVGMSFARAFVSREVYAESIDGAGEGEVEYEITRATWNRDRSRGATVGPGQAGTARSTDGLSR